MKTLLSIVFLLFVFQSNGQWTKSNTTVNQTIYNMVMVDSQLGFSVGGNDEFGSSASNAVLLKTLDGGNNWTQELVLNQCSFTDIGYTISQGDTNVVIFAISDYVPFLLTKNLSGSTWDSTGIFQEPVRSSTVDGKLYFIDKSSGSLMQLLNQTSIVEIVPNVSIYQIKNDTLVGLNSEMDSVKVLDLTTGQIQLIEIPSHVDFSNNQGTKATINFFGSTILIKGTYPGTVVYTSDFGITWQANNQITVPESEGISVNRNNLFSLRHDNLIMRSGDKGASWITDFTPSGTALNGHFYSSQDWLFLLNENGGIYRRSTLNLGTESLNIQNISIYPNPTSNMIFIGHSEHKGQIAYRVYDLKGNLVINAEEPLIDVSKLKSGTYLINIVAADFISTGQFVKQ